MHRIPATLVSYALVHPQAYVCISAFAVAPSASSAACALCSLVFWGASGALGGTISTIRVLRQLRSDVEGEFRNSNLEPVALSSFLTQSAVQSLSRAPEHAINAFRVAPQHNGSPRLVDPCAYPVFGGSCSTVLLPEFSDDLRTIDKLILHHELGHIAGESRYLATERDMTFPAVSSVALQWLVGMVAANPSPVMLLANLSVVIFALMRVRRPFDKGHLELSFESQADAFALETCKDEPGFKQATRLYGLIVSKQSRMRPEARQKRFDQLNDNIGRIGSGRRPFGIPVYSSSDATVMCILVVSLGLLLPTRDSTSLAIEIVALALVLVALRYASAQLLSANNALDSKIWQLVTSTVAPSWKLANSRLELTKACPTYYSFRASREE